MSQEAAELVTPDVPVEVAPPEAVPPADPLAHLPAWVRAVAEPLGANGGGEDPRYGDNFGTIKSEIEKLGGNNYEQVASLAKQVLAEEGKDLRIAGYLVLATLYLEGFQGLGNAIEAYRIIIDRFWDNCFPPKESGRIQALTWLGNERMAGFLQKQNGDALDLGQVEALRNTVKGFNQSVRTRLGSNAPQWDSLNSLLDRLHASKREAQANLEQEQREQDAHMRQSSAENAPLSDERAENMIARVARHYRERGERGRAVALLRAFRWGSLAVPPNEGGRTRIPPFRSSAFDEIKALQAGGGTPEQVFALCEDLFMEPGAQWNLDLQAITHRTLTVLNDDGAVQVLEAEVAGVLKRCPMTELSYDGGVPFVGAEAAEWLENLAADAEPTGGSPGPDDEAAREIVKRAEQAASNKNAKAALMAGLAVLRELDDRTGRARFKRRLEEARLCVRTRHSEMALPILDSLERDLGSVDLGQWEPGLALQLWRVHLQALQQEIPRADAVRKSLLEEQAREINASVCTTNLEEAVRMKRPAKQKGVATNGG